VVLEKYFDHKCRCGNVVEVVITLKGAGFEGSMEGGEETSFEYSFGDLKIEIGQKE
jgi:hypothetical protein